MSHKTLPRRRFLGQSLASLPAMGYLVLVQFLAWARSEPGSPSATAMIDRAVKFLRPRQDAKGGWSTQREPGITALVVTALLRSGEVTPADPMVTRALDVPGGVHRPQGGAVRGAARELLDLDRPGGLPAGERERPVRPRDQGRPGLPQDDAVGRVRGEEPRRRLLRRRGLRRRATAGPTCRTPPSSWRPCATRACPPTTRTCRRRWSSSRGARTSRASSTTSPGPARSTTAASSTRPPRGAAAWPARTPTAASAPTPA